MATDIFSASNLKLIESSTQFMQSDNGDYEFERECRPIHPDSVLVWPPGADFEHLGDVREGIYEPQTMDYSTSTFRPRGSNSWRSIVCKALLSCRLDELPIGHSCHVSDFLRLNGSAPFIGADVAESLHVAFNNSRARLASFLGSTAASDDLHAYHLARQCAQAATQELFWQHYDNWIEALGIGAEGGLVRIAW